MTSPQRVSSGNSRRGSHHGGIGFGPLGHVAAQQKISRGPRHFRFDPSRHRDHPAHIADIPCPVRCRSITRALDTISAFCDAKGQPPTSSMRRSAVFQDRDRLRRCYALTPTIRGAGGNMAAWAASTASPHLVNAVRTRAGADKVLLIDGATPGREAERAAKQGRHDRCDVRAQLDAMTAHWEFPLAPSASRGVDSAPFCASWRRTSRQGKERAGLRGAHGGGGCTRRAASRLLSLVRRCRAPRGAANPRGMFPMGVRLPRGGHPEESRKPQLTPPASSCFLSHVASSRRKSPRRFRASYHT